MRRGDEQMTFPLDNPQLRELMAALDRSLAELERVTAEAKARYSSPPKELTEEELAEIERNARSADAPKGLRELQRLVDAGELSWRDVASGQAMGDPRVERALSDGLSDAARAYQMIREGHDPDEVAAVLDPQAGYATGTWTHEVLPRQPVSPGSTWNRPSSRPASSDDDDDTEFSYLH